MKKPSSNYLPTLSGLVISFVFFCFICFSLFNYGSIFDVNIIAISFAITTVWAVAFLISIYKTAINFSSIIISLFLLIIFSVYLLYAIWFGNYLTLDIYTIISNGAIHIDTFFHATMARTFLEYGSPQILASGVTPLYYHTGSHFVLGLISLITDINIVFVYNYLFPIMFIPLFSFLIFKASIAVKSVLNSSSRIIRNFDLFAIVIYFVPFLSINTYSESGVFIRNYFRSESFLVANSLLLIVIIIQFKLFEKNYINKTCKAVWCLLCVPLFIFVIAFTKISVGAILVTGIAYYVFRKHTFSLKHWLLNIWYAFSFILFYLYYNGFFDNADEPMQVSSTKFELFSFAKERIQPGNELFHVLFLSGFALIICAYKLQDISSIKKFIIERKYVMEEALLVITIVAFLPGTFLYIAGGSAGYFLLVPGVVGLVFFIANDLPKKIHDFCLRTATIRIVSKVVIVLLLISFISNSYIRNTFSDTNNQIIQSTTFDLQEYNLNKDKIKSGNIIDGVMGILSMHFSPNKHMSEPIVSNLIYLDGLPLEQKKKSVVFIDESSKLWELYPDGDELLFLISGYTGIQTYNMLFYNENGIPTYHNSLESARYGYGYGINKIKVHDEKYSIETAKIKAKDEGYTYLFHFSGDDVEKIVL